MITRNEILGCLSKRSYSTEEAALFFAKADSLDYYFCRYCGEWHLTSKPGAIAGKIEQHGTSKPKGKAGLTARQKRRPTSKQRRRFILFRKRWRARECYNYQSIIGS